MRGVAALVLAVVGLAGCGREPVAPGDRPAPSVAAPAPVPGIRAEVVRLRTDEAAGGRVHVRIIDTGDEPFTVTAVALDAPGFAPLPPTAVTAAFVPGRVIDLPAPHGEVVCRVEPGAPAALLTLRRPDGATDEVRVPLEGEALDRVHREECTTRTVARAMEVEVTGLVVAEDALAGRLALTRRVDGGRVVVERLGGSVLVDAAADLPLELPAGDETVDAPVRFAVATCDAHVLAESKKPYLFPVTVRLGTASPVVVDLPLDDGQRRALADLVARSCGSGS